MTFVEMDRKKKNDEKMNLSNRVLAKSTCFFLKFLQITRVYFKNKNSDFFSFKRSRTCVTAKRSFCRFSL